MKNEYSIKILEQEIERRQIILRSEQYSLIMCKDEPALFVKIIARLKNEINDLKRSVKMLKLKS